MPPCRLCLTEKPLRESHIIPAFIVRWLKETSATGYIRFTVNPNKREQDGPKGPFLCADCEQVLSKWETPFAQEFWPKITGQEQVPWKYGEWLAPFAASLCWRALLFRQEIDENTLDHLDERHKPLVGGALENWRKYLLGSESGPGNHELHFLPLGPIESLTGPKPPSNFNRYLCRSLDIDVVGGANQSFVYCKPGPMCFLGFISPAKPGTWEGTRIEIGGGFFRGKASLPSSFADYLNEKAEKTRIAQDKLSDRQREVIRQAIEKDLDRVAKSGSFEALDADVRMSGMDEVFPDQDQGNRPAS